MSSRDSFESDVRSSTRDSKSKENSTVKSSSISLIAKKKSKLDKELLIVKENLLCACIRIVVYIINVLSHLTDRRYFSDI